MRKTHGAFGTGSKPVLSYTNSKDKKLSKLFVNNPQISPAGNISNTKLKELILSSGSNTSLKVSPNRVPEKDFANISQTGGKVSFMLFS